MHLANESTSNGTVEPTAVMQTSRPRAVPNDNSNLRRFVKIKPGLGGLELDVMIYGQHLSKHRPLVITSSVEFPVPPSERFCDLMWDHGLQVIFIRRPGYGGSTRLPKVLLTKQNILNGAAVIAEAALISQLFARLNLKSFTLLGLGSSNPLCYRLAVMNSQIELSIFANSVFNQDIIDVFRPKWLQGMLRQSLTSQSGVRIAAAGLKFQFRRHPDMFYRPFLQKSEGDTKYYADNAADFLSASRTLLDVQPETFYYDVVMSLMSDSFLRDQLFQNTNAAILAGEETSDQWRSALEREAGRLALPVIYAPLGDVFVPYASPDVLLSIISEKTAN